MDYAGAFGSGAVIAWLIAFVWFPRYGRTIDSPIRYLIISAVGILGVLAMAWMQIGNMGVLTAFTGLLFSTLMSLKVRRDIHIRRGQRRG